MKKLRRSRTDRIVAGVLGGLGHYLELDPVLLRLLYVILTVFTGFIPGIVGYLIAIAVVPQEPYITPSQPETAKVNDDTSV